MQDKNIIATMKFTEVGAIGNTIRHKVEVNMPIQIMNKDGIFHINLPLLGDITTFANS